MRKNYKKITNEFSFILKPSPIDGVGVFALHAIAKGTKLSLKPNTYKTRKLKENGIPKELLKYCIVKHGSYRMCPTRFNCMWFCWYLNHSNTPTAQGDTTDSNFTVYALRNINAGEEITIDYQTYGCEGETAVKDFDNLADPSNKNFLKDLPKYFKGFIC